MQTLSVSRATVAIGILTVVTVLFGLGVSGQQQAPDRLMNSLLGSWKVNVANSKYDPGPPPRSSVATIERGENGFFKNIVETVDAQGRSSRVEVVAKLDGKDYPMQGAQPAGTTRAHKTIDDRNMEAIIKRPDGNTQNAK